MSKAYGESAAIFKPLLVAGIIILAFGVVCILDREFPQRGGRRL
jgi:hypothetical protein